MISNPYPTTQTNSNLNFRLFIPPRPGTVYNIQCQHLVKPGYLPKVEHQLMPKETALYSTIVRSTVTQFKSAFSFFGGEAKMRKVCLGNFNNIIAHNKLR